MKALIVVSLLGFCLLGVMTASASAQAIGPSCLNIAEFAEVAQFFALPTGGGQVILTGQSLTFGDAYTGSGYLVGSDFTFSVASGLLGLMEGVLNLSTGQGVGSVTFADTNEIQPLTYSLSAPPCAAP
jgi:hypothetical protein